jgi:hypothetical protein
VKSPNAELGSLLSQWNATTIVREVLASPRITEYRYALLTSLANACTSVETIPPDVERSFGETYGDFKAETHRAFDRHEALKELRALARDNHPVVGANPFAMNRFRYVVEAGMGLRPLAWSIAFERGSYDPPGSGFASLFLEGVSLREPWLRKLFEEASEGDCRELQQRSLTQLRSLASFPLKPAAAEPATSSGPTAASRDRAVADLLKTCVGCHQQGPGPSIPFDDLTAFRMANDQMRHAHGSLLAEILYRLGPDAGARRMPLGTVLTAGEVASLETYFQHAARDDTARAATGP